MNHRDNRYAHDSHFSRNLSTNSAAFGVGAPKRDPRTVSPNLDIELPVRARRAPNNSRIPPREGGPAARQRSTTSSRVGQLPASTLFKNLPQASPKSPIPVFPIRSVRETRQTSGLLPESSYVMSMSERSYPRPRPSPSPNGFADLNSGKNKIPIPSSGPGPGSNKFGIQIQKKIPPAPASSPKRNLNKFTANSKYAGAGGSGVGLGVDKHYPPIPPTLEYQEEDYSEIRSELLELVEKQKSKSSANKKSSKCSSRSPLTMNISGGGSGNRSGSDFNLFQEPPPRHTTSNTEFARTRLDELTSLFRDNLSKVVRRDPMDVIKLPKSVNKEKLAAALTKNASSKKVSYGVYEGKLFDDEIDEDEDQEQDVDDTGERSENSGSEMEKIGCGVFGKFDKKKGGRNRHNQKSESPADSKPKSRKHKKKKEVRPSESDGLIELRQLLESHSNLGGTDISSFNSNPKTSKGSGSSSGRKKKEKPLSHNPYLQAQELLDKYRSSGGSGRADDNKTPELSTNIFQIERNNYGDPIIKKYASTGSPGDIAQYGGRRVAATSTQSTSTGTSARDSSWLLAEAQARTKPGHVAAVAGGSLPYKTVRIPTEVIQEKLESSIQNTGEAVKVANALGSLMSRIAATRPTGAGADQLDYSSTHPSSTDSTGRRRPMGTTTLTQTFGSTTQGIQTDVSTAAAATTTMSSSGKNRASWSSLSKSTLLQEKIASIQFTKDMSVEDEAKLRELRMKKKEWENYQFQQQT